MESITIFDPRVLEWLHNSNQIMFIDDSKEIYVYTWFMAYRTQRAFYDLYVGHHKRPGSLEASWDEFQDFIRPFDGFRKTCVSVIEKAVSRFLSEHSFNYDSPKVKFYYEEDEKYAKNGVLNFVPFFSGYEGHIIVERLLVQSQIGYYRRCLKNQKNLTWGQYVTFLKRSPESMQVIVTAFCDALSHLDFKSAWKEKVNE